MKVSIDQKGLSEATRAVMELPGLFKRARASALKSTGWFVRGELRSYVEKGGEGWPDLHPLTAAFRKKRGAAAGKWIKRRKGKESALYWLGKFARYRVDADRGAVQIDFGKSKKGKPGAFDPGLIGIVERAEEGERIRVTGAMRKFLAATRRKRPKSQAPGETYFPLKKSTRELVIPRRPIFDPVWRKVSAGIPGHFEEKFWAALERYEKGAAKT